MMKQRYNVAVSRARNQLWLIHSLDPSTDLKQHDLRKLLIEHVRNPRAVALAMQQASAKSESPFEAEVAGRLIADGYCVKQQVWIGSYRLDMVVSNGNFQVALECDGDKFHGFDQVEEDMARQAVLERAGWVFVRVRGTRYFRQPDATISWVKDQLARHGITPTEQTKAEDEGSDAKNYRYSVIRRAQEIMREYGWIAGTAASESPTSAS